MVNEMGDTLGLRLAQLSKGGANRFDPVRFCYIASLVRRSAGKRASVYQHITHKALMALDDYQVRFQKARREAADIVARVCVEHPDSAGRIRERFADGDFKDVRRLGQRLDRGGRRRMLLSLTHQMARGQADTNGNASQPSFDERLRRQENEAVQSVENSPTGGGTARKGRQAAPLSFHLFKATWEKHNADELVTHAIMDRPENPGPLNGQMLATRSLSAMRELSPNYLKRFVTYIEALFWLQRAGKDVKGPGKK